MTANPHPSARPPSCPRPSAADLLDDFLASRRSSSVKASDAVRAVVIREAAAQLPPTWLDDDDLLTAIDPDNEPLAPMERLGLEGLLTVLLFWTSSVALSRGRDSPETIACCRWSLRLARHAIKATGRPSYGYASILRDIEYPRVG
ncbi:MAG: hypothetical protein ACTHK1_09495 [Actinomycetales bacterium]